MKEIEKLINQGYELTHEQVLNAFFEIGLNGDIIMIKNDGLRQATDRFAIVIVFSNESLESIRVDSNSLSDAMIKALKRYMEKRKQNPC